MKEKNISCLWLLLLKLLFYLSEASLLLFQICVRIFPPNMHLYKSTDTLCVCCYPMAVLHFLLLWFTKDLKDNEHSLYNENNKDDHSVV